MTRSFFQLSSDASWKFKSISVCLHTVWRVMTFIIAFDILWALGRFCVRRAAILSCLENLSFGRKNSS